MRRFFESSHILKRHLVLPDPTPDGGVPDEDGKVIGGGGVLRIQVQRSAQRLLGFVAPSVGPAKAFPVGAPPAQVDALWLDVQIPAAASIGFGRP